MINLIMKCSTCKHSVNNSCEHPMREDFVEMYAISFCLVDITYSNRNVFIHPKYPEYTRPYKRYEYVHWEPKIENINYLLTDKDFEI